MDAPALFLIIKLPKIRYVNEAKYQQKNGALPTKLWKSLVRILSTLTGSGWERRGPRFWDELARREETDQEAIGAPRSQRFAPPFFYNEVREGSLVLEVGVGYGRFARPLAVERRVRLVGIDVSASMLGRAWRNMGDLSNVDLVRGDATHMPFRDGVFDLAYSLASLYFIRSWEKAVENIVRVLKKGGKAYLDFRDLSLRNVVRELVLRTLILLGLEKMWKYGHPYFLTSKKKAARLLEKLGMGNIRVLERRYRFVIYAEKLK